MVNGRFLPNVPQKVQSTSTLGGRSSNRKLIMTIHLTDLTRSKSAPITLIHRHEHNAYRHFGKRLLDTFLVLLTSPIIFPIIALLALAIAFTGQNPFYSQKRIGLNGNVFRMWKLRTMLPNAEQHLEDYLESNPEARVEWDSKQKLIHDPRVTPLGHILRKTSLDELPQFFNVLNGTMSLVGPRPMMLCQQGDYAGSGYYELRPGISGFWQISDRNESDFVGRVRFDEIYNRKVSLGTDINVMVRTIGVMLRCTGC